MADPGESATLSRTISRDREARIAALAAGQHGVIARWQLMSAGVSSSAIGRRIDAGRLRALFDGVYLMGPVEPERAFEAAAVLAGGPGAALSHTNAVGLWKLQTQLHARPAHVVTPGRYRQRQGVTFHRVRSLADDEVATVEGIRVTAPGRTIVDVASMLGHRELERIVATAEREGLIHHDQLVRLLARHRGRPGTAMLRAILGQSSGPQLTRSEAERICRDLFRRAGLPTPHANVAIGPYELDLFFPDENVAIEVDGHAWHSSRDRFEGDRRRDAWLRSRGIEVVRLTWRQITRDPIATAVQVGQILALARSRARPAQDAEHRLTG